MPGHLLSPGWAQKALWEPFWPLKHPDHEPLQWELSYWAFLGIIPDPQPGAVELGLQ